MTLEEKKEHSRQYQLKWYHDNKERLKQRKNELEEIELKIKQRREKERERHKKYKAQKSEYMRNRRLQNLDVFKEKWKNRTPDQKEKDRESWRKTRAKACSLITDGHVRKEIIRTYGLKSEDITPELIEAKRLEINFKRLKKQFKTATNGTEN
ncbi:hypothetical protein JZU61_04350 [bacterium]|jgi:hypothetical protein|nr:hypothetical protein [bacterium]